jgi:hypothetical protein
MIFGLLIMIFDFWMAAYYCESIMWITFWAVIFLHDSYQFSKKFVENIENK